MSRSIFGSDYPPGCHSVPGDEEFPCEVCGNMADVCICPECTVCGEQGNPNCYVEHGMVKSPEQVQAFIEFEQRQKDSNDAEQARFFTEEEL